MMSGVWTTGELPAHSCLGFPSNQPTATLQQGQDSVKPCWSDHLPTHSPTPSPAILQPRFQSLIRAPLPSQIGDLTVVAQAFGLSLEEPGSFMEYAVFDGILGLGYPDLGFQGITPVFDNLWIQGLIPQNLFAFYLSR